MSNAMQGLATGSRDGKPTTREEVAAHLGKLG